MTVSLRSPVSGLAVNSTPEDWLSTICWTTTANAISTGSTPLRSR